MSTCDHFSAHAKFFWTTRASSAISLVVLLLFLFDESHLFSQTQSAPHSQTQPTPVGSLSDLALREINSGLDVDRDPVRSPDPEDNVPINAAFSANTDRTGALQKRQDGIYTMHKDVDEVLQYCTVVDEKGNLVTDLSRINFRIWEDGVPQTSSSFQHQDVPVSIGIVVDNSGSMRDKRAAVNVAALDLVRASNPKDAAFIVNFSDKAFLDQGFTSEIASLDRGLSHFDSKGATALYDAVAASADELSTHASNPKQALLVITDGADNASRLTLEEAIGRVQLLGGPVVYSIGLLFDIDKEESRRASSALKTLSQETGGSAYFPRSLEDVDKIAAEVARDIRSQYTIGYRSTKLASIEGYRVVRVEASAPDHGKLIVRTRRGYFAKKSTQQVRIAQEANK
jgi:Ca-activated chloride channel family protein